MSLEDISYLLGSHLILWTKTICVILVEGIMALNIYVKLF